MIDLLTPLKAQVHAAAAPLAATAVVVFTIALAAALLRAGFVAPTAFGWSTSILLDGGWRLYQGQVPHSDFHSPIGYAYLLLVSSAMHLWGPAANALAQAAAMVVLPLAAAAWFLASRRLSPVFAALITAFIAVHAGSISFFGTSDNQGISFSGQYTRIAWGIFFLIPVQILLDPLVPLGRGRALAENLIVGAALGALFGIKITFFAGGVICVIAGLLLRPGQDRWRTVATMVAACSAVIALGLAASGASAGAYFSDLVMTQRSNSASLLHLLVEQAGRTDVAQACLLIAGLAMVWPLAFERRVTGPARINLVRGLGLLILGCGISAYNGTEYASPILALCTLILCATALPAIAPTAVAAVALVIPLLTLGVPVLKAGLHGRPDPGASDSFALPPYQGVDFVAGSHADEGPLIACFSRTAHAVFATAYLRSLREGVDQLRRYVPEGSVVVTMDVANPFPFALGWPSPKGDVLFWHLDRNVSAATAPKAEILLAHVQAVMVPTCAQMAGVPAGKMAIYRPYLEAHFQRVQLPGEWWSEVWIRPEPERHAQRSSTPTTFFHPIHLAHTPLPLPARSRRSP